MNNGASRRRWRLLGSFVLILAALELLACVVAYLAQEELVFEPQPLTAARVREIAATHPALHVVTLTNDAGLKLQGWSEATRPGDDWLLYFHGVGEEASFSVRSLAEHTGWHVLGYNARGLGQSEGRPSEAALFADALNIYDALQRDHHPHRLVIMGHSLGTGVATYLAQHRRADGVILISPYDSVASVGKTRFPFLPVDCLLRDRFDMLPHAAAVHLPLLAVVGTRDGIVPPQHSLRLLAAWGGPHTLLTLPGAGHTTIMQPPTWQAIGEFLAARASARD